MVEPQETQPPDPQETELLARGTAADITLDQAAPPRPVPPGQDAIGPYRVVSRLGAGGMGEVVEVEDLELRRRVAAKRLHPTAPTAAFVREARIAGQLEHPNIVPIYHLGYDERGPFFTMRKIDGVDLDRFIARARGGAPDAPRLHRRLAIFDRVCDAMAFAHDRSVIHRDLKPANIMLGAFGEVLAVHHPGPQRSVSGRQRRRRGARKEWRRTWKSCRSHRS